jgi:hypothetical protein
LSAELAGIIPLGRQILGEHAGVGTFRWSFPCPSLAGGLGDVAAVTDGYEKGLAVVVEISVRGNGEALAGDRRCRSTRGRR